MTMSTKLFDYINIINMKGEIPENLEEYNSFMVNKNFSNIAETVLYANAVNVEMDPKLHFDFYYYSLPKKKRWGKWHKAQKVQKKYSDVLNNIIEHYSCSKVKAEEIYAILEATNQLDKFAELYDIGGKVR